MDKTIEIVLVAVVVLATAAIGLLMVTGQASDFGDLVSGIFSDGQCDLAQERYEGAYECEDGSDVDPDWEDFEPDNGESCDQPASPC